MKNNLRTNIKKITRLSIQRRGEIIEKFTYLEMIMDNIISRYFCSSTDKTDELTAVVLSTIDFSKKKDVIFYIMDSHKTTVDKHKGIKSDLDNLNKVRNIFAHRYLATFDHNIADGNLSYIKFEKLIDKCYQALSDLDDVVRTWPLPKKKKSRGQNNER
jgi:hypothetical protein